MSAPQTVLITGCSDGGIGSSLAATFHSKGFHVFATARNLSKITKLPKDDRVTLLALDITDSEAIRAAVQAVSKRTGGTLDYLVNNAARNHFMPMLDDDLDFARKLFDNNTFGPIAVTQAFTPLILKCRGSITFITSCSSRMNVPYMGTYSASKGALDIMADTLRVELNPFGVKVLCIVVGVVQTMGQTYFEDLALPENSLYKSVEQKFLGMARGTGNPFPKMPAEEFAKGAVKDIIGGRVGHSWHGSAVGFLKALTGWGPQSFADWIYVKDTGMYDLGGKKQ